MNIPDFLIEAIEKGVEITLKKDTEIGIVFDVNTRAKSHVWLTKNNNDTYTAFLRYNETFEVQDFYGLASIVKHAMHGRDFIDCSWLEILKELELIRFTTKTVTSIIYD